jgi:uncharacterized protein
MDVAIIGSGISGLLSARLISTRHTVTVYEAGDYIGGHTHTIPLRVADQDFAVDTGFIVFNPSAYPNFSRLLELLKVPSQPASMSFSVACESTGLEYASTNANSIFAQRLNLLRPAFWKMLRDIARFFREAEEVLDSDFPEWTLGEYLRSRRYSEAFLQQHLLPLGAAIWSADTRQIENFPARMFVQFFRNHGFLSVNRRAPWRVISGGSSQYIAPLTAPFRNQIKPHTPVASVKRLPDCVELRTVNGARHFHDEVVLAVHSPTALRLLADASAQERSILGAMPYQRSDVVLHTDTGLMPRNRRAWASWNFHLPASGLKPGHPTVTYWMNKLQTLRAPCEFLVTLNRSGEIRPETVLGRYEYEHPLFSFDSFKAQARYAEIGGVRRTHFCGAYWGYGFHEDAVSSALRVARHFGLDLNACTAPSTKVRYDTVATVP